MTSQRPENCTHGVLELRPYSSGVLFRPLVLDYILIVMLRLITSTRNIVTLTIKSFSAEAVSSFRAIGLSCAVRDVENDRYWINCQHVHAIDSETQEYDVPAIR